MLNTAASPSTPLPTTTVVLAGGGSQRMGRDKRKLVWKGVPMLEHTLALAHELGNPVLLADGGQTAGAAFREAALVQVERCPDGPGAGPASGLLGAAGQRPSDHLFALACDLPLLSVELAKTFLGRATRRRPDVAMIQSHGQLHPLFACYSPRAIAVLRDQVAEGNYSLRRLLEAQADTPTPPAVGALPRQLDVVLFSPRDLGMERERVQKELLNCNRPIDWHRARDLAYPPPPTDRSGPFEG